MAFIPQNDLEQSLLRASTAPECRPQFYRDLLKSDLFVVQDGPPPLDAGKSVLESGMKLRIMPIEWEGRPYLPVFSSPLRLQAVLTHEASYLGLNAAVLMKITKGADLLLNFGSECGKVLEKDEIAALLSGEMFEPAARVIKEDTNVLLGEPARYPAALVEALAAYFKTIPEVEKAYLAHILDPSEAQKGHTLIALQVKGDWDKVRAGVGPVISGIEIPDPPVDMMRITGQGGLEDYFTQSAKPFYRRKRFGFF